MKVAVAFYYKNIEQYPREWVVKCLNSYYQQTFQDFDVFEMNYGGGFDLRRYVIGFELNQWKCGKEHYYKGLCCDNYAEAMNEIYSWIFQTHDVVVNTNVDDYYDQRRIELLLQEIENGYDIVSSNYHIVDENDSITWSTDYAKKDVYQQFKDGANPVSNPGHLMHRRVFESGLRFDASLIPIEDYHFWLQAIEAGFKIKIRPEFLHYYRQHSLQETHRYGK